MQTYIQLNVPITFEEPWFRQMRELLKGFNIRWQQRYYHITMAFLDEAPYGVNLLPGLNQRLNNAKAPTLTFDKLDAFGKRGDNFPIIHLTTNKIPDGFLAMVKDLRQYFNDEGCVMQKDFRLHITLGRVQDPRLKVHALRPIFDQIDLPAMTMTLDSVEYLILQGHVVVGKWQLNK